MRYTLRIFKTQPDHLGEAPPVTEYLDRFESPVEAADFASAAIAAHEAPEGAYAYDVLDEAGRPLDGFTGVTP